MQVSFASRDPDSRPFAMEIILQEYRSLPHALTQPRIQLKDRKPIVVI
jgi:hypothetical protein